MMDRWTKDKLRNLPIEFVDGDRYSKYPKRKEFASQGVPFLNAESINEGYINLRKANFITKEKFSEIKKGRCKTGDLILTTRGNGVGKSAFFWYQNKTALINAQLLIVRADNQYIFSRFLYYSFISPYFQNTLKNFVSGSAQPQLPIQSLREVEISLPPLPIQHKIAAILSTYDDLIENNTRRIEILEEMARMLYREWFVKFRYPGHESDRLVESELGLIPEGWTYTKIKDLPIEIIDGDRSKNYPKRSEFVEQGVLFLNTKNIVNNKINLTDSNFITREKFLSVKKGRVEPLDIVMTTRGSIGKVALFNCEHYQALINAQMLIMRADRTLVNQIFLFLLMCSEEFKTKLTNFASGAAQPQIPITDLREIKVLYPPTNTQNQFSDIVFYYYSLIKNLQQKNNNLSQTRDLLLPRLISGEIDVENLNIKTE